MDSIPIDFRVGNDAMAWTMVVGASNDDSQGARDLQPTCGSDE